MRAFCLSKLAFPSWRVTRLVRLRRRPMLPLLLRALEPELVELQSWDTAGEATYGTRAHDRLRWHGQVLAVAPHFRIPCCFQSATPSCAGRERGRTRTCSR